MVYGEKRQGVDEEMNLYIEKEEQITISQGHYEITVSWDDEERMFRIETTSQQTHII